MATVDLPKILPYQPVRMSVERYHRLIEAGAFSEQDAFELLDGVVSETMSKNPPHRIATRLCDLALSRIAPKGWHVQNQEPVTFSNSEPEPDVAVIRGELADYASRHPGALEIALVVEVADTSLVTDRYKAQLYAEARIPTYWIVNLSERVIEVFEEPTLEAGTAHYTKTRLYSLDEPVPVVIDGKHIASLPVKEWFPLASN